MNEPEIIINGVRLTIGQATVVRVAITDLHQSMGEQDVLGSDTQGREMAEAYRDRAAEVLKLLGALRGPEHG